jgi:cysteine synthase
LSGGSPGYVGSLQFHQCQLNFDTSISQSCFLLYTRSPHKIQGIGAGFIPGNADTSLLDEVVQISGEDAMAMARRMATEEGIFCGISSGAAVLAAIQIASRPENKGKRVVTVIPSFGERYLSTALFQNLWDEAAALKPESVA